MLTPLRPFFRHLAGRKKALSGLFCLGLVGSAAGLASPLIGKAFIDAVATRHDYGAIPGVAAALVGLAAMDLLVSVVSRLAHARFSAHLLVEIRQRLFDRCLHAPLGQLEPFRHGDLLARFGSDVPRVQSVLADSLLGGLQSLLFLGVAAGLLWRLSPPLALWSFLGVAVALTLTAGFRGPVERGARGIREAMADLSHFLAERLGAIRQVRFHHAENQDQIRFTDLNRRLVHRVLSFQAVDATASGLPGLALTLGLAWIYLLGGRLLESGSISLGTFVAFILYQGRLYGPAQGLLGLVRGLQEARISLERVAEVLGDETSTGPIQPDRAPAGEIRLEGVTFAYGDAPPVLRGADLHVRPGEKVALFGTSGAGKSTLVQLLFGLREPGSGLVRIAGPGGTEPHRVLGYACAEPFLLHASVEDNLRYGCPDARPEAVVEAARLAEAHGFILSLPDGFATVVGGRGLALSDGQRQRLGLARLILRNPDVLILDEAFSALDPETEFRVRRNLWEAFPDRATLVISHRRTGLAQFDRLLWLRDGTLHPVTVDELNDLDHRSAAAGGALCCEPSPPGSDSLVPTPQRRPPHVPHPHHRPLDPDFPLRTCPRNAHKPRR